MVHVKKYGLTVYDLTRDKKIPPSAVYVGRPTSFFSPFSHVDDFSIHKTKTAAEAVRRYRVYVGHNLAVGKDARRHLYKKDLVCNCGSDDCHALVLMELAHEPAPPQNSMLAPDQDRPRVVEPVPEVAKPKVVKEKKVKHVPTFKEF